MTDKDREIQRLQALVYMLYDDEECRMTDLHGVPYCETHDHIYWNPGDMCPHAVAYAVLPASVALGPPCNFREWVKEKQQ